MSLRVATESELAPLWPALSASRTFPSREAFDEFWASGPWRVLIDEHGRAAVLERWREHLDILSIKGVWCAERDLSRVLGDVRSVASSHGFARIMSPLVSRDDAGPYREAGMRELELIVALRSDLHGARADASDDSPDELELSVGAGSISDDLLHVDELCFPAFWRYGRPSIESMFGSGRVTLASESDQVIGYTWCTIDRGIGTLGRLAVLPDARGRGVGKALLDDALCYMSRTGADVVSLCTQETNTASRALYARAGLRELPGRLVFLVQEV